MLSLLRSLVVVVALATFSGTASAIPLVVACASASGPTEVVASIGCAKFDTALGFLTSVSISITGNISGSMTFTNNGSGTQSFTGTTTVRYSIGALAGFNFVNPLLSTSVTGNAIWAQACRQRLAD